ncbi:unnamed protein product [Pleuronectes platessa]|uniref:Uncharacterized protein n=1 Tax=Pleuronectes platessa TaxID=8262 RepID=A0A9N7UWN8_PLEPL|nr:unnamed protein product [Pleuronectes platessa]
MGGSQFGSQIGRSKDMQIWDGLIETSKLIVGVNRAAPSLSVLPTEHQHSTACWDLGCHRRTWGLEHRDAERERSAQLRLKEKRVLFSSPSDTFHCLAAEKKRWKHSKIMPCEEKKEGVASPEDGECPPLSLKDPSSFTLMKSFDVGML